MTGLVAQFAGREALVNAVGRLRADGFTALDTVTPYPVPSLDDVIGGRPSLIPLIILIAGLTGLFGGFAMEVYAAVVSYPLNIGGRPLFSWPAFVPIAFEIGVLLAIGGGFFGFLILNRLPALYVPGLEAPIFRDGWILIVRTNETGRLRPLLEALHPVRVAEWRA